MPPSSRCLAARAGPHFFHALRGRPSVVLLRVLRQRLHVRVRFLLHFSPSYQVRPLAVRILVEYRQQVKTAGVGGVYRRRYGDRWIGELGMKLESVNASDHATAHTASADGSVSDGDT